MLMVARSCAPDPLNKLSFPQPQEDVYKIYFQANQPGSFIEVI